MIVLIIIGNAGQKKLYYKMLYLGDFFNRSKLADICTQI